MVKHTSLGLFGFAWGLLGMCLLLLTAIVRLGAIALTLLDQQLEMQHWLALILFVGFMAYSEGYKGFQASFSPRFAARLRHLLTSDSALHILTAPLFCMGFYHTTRRRLISAYALTTMIIGFVIIAQSIPQPWRGILDAGVVIGLLWGLLSLVYFAALALHQATFTYSAELPAQTSR